MTVLEVFVPAAGSALERLIAARSAIVGTASSAPTGTPEGDRVLIDYEGNLYGSESLAGYEDRLLHAAGRHMTHYPTVARMMVPPSELHPVGTYDYDNRRLYVDDREALDSWLDPEGD